MVPAFGAAGAMIGPEVNEVNLTRKRVFKEQQGKPRVATRQIGDETIIVPISSGVGELDAIYTLNDLGSRIWQLIDGPTSVMQIVETIHREYDVSEGVATSDVVEFLEQLESRKLIRWSQD